MLAVLSSAVSCVWDCAACALWLRMASKLSAVTASNCISKMLIETSVVRTCVTPHACTALLMDTRCARACKPWAS